MLTVISKCFLLLNDFAVFYRILGLLLPPTTVLNQFGFVLFIGVAIDTFIVRTIIVPAAVTAFSLSLCRVPKVCSKTADTDMEDADKCPAYLNSKAIGDDHEKSVWRAGDADVNWWPYLVPKALLSLEGEEAALWAGYNNPADYVAEMDNPTPVIFGISDAVSIT
jgi:MMPL family